MISPLQFSLHYLFCLTFCIGSIELLKAAVEIEEPEPPATTKIKAIAIPPRPDGVRAVKGEGAGDSVYYTEEGCRKLSDQYQDICFHQLGRQRGTKDIKGGVEACEKIKKSDTKWECMSDVAEVYAPFDRAASLELCPKIKKKKWRDQCVFGIALTYSTKDSEWAFKTCDQAGQWYDFCRHDVNGEIAVVNTDLAMNNCEVREGDALTQKVCWHGIGKYIARVNVDRAFEACSKVPLGPNNIFRENCIHGLGWGATEKAGISFVQVCERAGEQKDSCLLGVAYNLRRFDVSQAMTVCDQVRRSDLNVQCEAFVNRGSIHR